MFRSALRFLKDDSGTTTVEWVVLAAATVGIGLAAAASVRSGTEVLGNDMRDSMYDSGVVGACDDAPIVYDLQYFTDTGSGGTLADATTHMATVAAMSDDELAQTYRNSWFNAQDLRSQDADLAQAMDINYILAAEMERRRIDIPDGTTTFNDLLAGATIAIDCSTSGGGATGGTLTGGTPSGGGETITDPVVTDPVVTVPIVTDPDVPPTVTPPTRRRADPIDGPSVDPVIDIYVAPPVFDMVVYDSGADLVDLGYTLLSLNSYDDGKQIDTLREEFATYEVDTLFDFVKNGTDTVDQAINNRDQLSAAYYLDLMYLAYEDLVSRGADETMIFEAQGLFNSAYDNYQRNLG